MKQFLLVLAVFCFISCHKGKEFDWSVISLKDLNGREVNVKEAVGSGIAVFVFMSPDCPLCINYTKTINDLMREFSRSKVVFIAVYSGGYYSKTEISGFEQEYNFEILSLLDPDLRLAELLEATVTPEAVVISREGAKVYSGAIDNWMYETGKKSPVITQKYLETALKQLLSGTIPDPSKTEPVGCFIEL